MAGSFVKDPDSKLDYGVDWTQWLGGDGIVTSEWSVAVPPGAPEGMHLNVSATPVPAVDGKITRVWLENGVLGVIYDVRNRITTVAGRREDRTMKVAVRTR